MQDIVLRDGGRRKVTALLSARVTQLQTRRWRVVLVYTKRQQGVSCVAVHHDDSDTLYGRRHATVTCPLRHPVGGLLGDPLSLKHDKSVFVSS